jgi:GH35 family endo-1,4-beta-xylanase
MTRKYKNKSAHWCIGTFIIALFAGLSSCYDEKMQWEDLPYGNLTETELPLELQEKIARYDVLNSYTNMVLGVGIDLNMYMTNETYSNVVNQNFDEITVGYDMKHGAMVNGQGNINFTKVDALISKLKEAGLTVYGHTLVWHSNQNATYLNDLLKPDIIPGTPGSSLIANGDFETGIAGWSVTYYAENVTSTDEGGAIDGTHAMKVIVGDFGGSKYNMQINSPSFPIISGHEYEISFFIKSDIEGAVGLDFPNADLSNQYPWTSGKEMTTTSGTWTKVTYNPTTTPDGMVAAADNSAMTFRLLLGAVQNCTYYIDAVEVIDLDAAPTEVNLVANGGFESGDLTGWSALNPGGGITVTGEEKVSGAYSAKLISGATATNAWDLQLESDQLTFDASKTYTFSFYVKSNIAGKGRVSFPGGLDGNPYPWLNWTGSGASEAFTTAAGGWTFVSVEFTNTTDVKLSFDMGYLPDVTYYLDDVKIVEKKAETGSMELRAGPVTIEKTPEEKAHIIDSVLHVWVKETVTHYKADVHAWDVVNEPMDDGKGSELKTGIGQTDIPSDAFYWQDYLGRDYAVKAFNWAHQYGNANDKMFINDYNLESNPNKLNGIIEYVQYIESKGAKVDGIGTQMHVSITSDKTQIDDMFKKLAATGKLVKISELDIKVNTAAPTADQLAEQAEMYRYILSSFQTNVPAAQQYGVTVWCVSDNSEEHENWIPDDAPCLWNADYARKHAYKGFADGLAGRDVSVDFPGTLQP